jgi:hypothetical protein
MSRQLVEKIFEPFQSQFEGGTGLGLAIVYQIVQAHEGKVWARSKPGHGTTLVLRLRRLDAERPGAERQNARAASVGDFASAELPAPSPAPLVAASAEGRLHG